MTTIETETETPNHERLGITKEQEDNFKLIRDYLRSDRVSKEFSMIGWCNCVAGQAFNILRTSGDHRNHMEAFVERAFGMKPNTPEFRFIFSAEWADVDDTPKGAADRIDAYLRGE